MNDWVSALFYLAMASSAASLLYLASKRQQQISRILLTSLALALPILVAGLRYNIGIDYAEYVRIYNQIVIGNLGAIQSIEPTYYLFSYLSNLAVHGPALLFILYSATFIIFSFFALKKLVPRHLPLAMLVLLLTVYPISLNAMRQMAAAAVVALALTFIMKRAKKGSFFGLVVLAAMFHFTALFALVFYPIVSWVKKYRTKPRYIWLALGAVGLLALLSPFILQSLAGVPFINRYTHLIADGQIAFHPSIRFFVDVGLLAIIWWLFGRDFKKSANKFTLFILLAFGMLIKAAGFFTLFGAGGRFSLYTIVLLPVILTYLVEMNINPKFPKFIRREWTKPRMAQIAIIVLAVGYFAGICLLDNSGYDILPYQMVIQ
jgi:hypothetical protein